MTDTQISLHEAYLLLVRIVLWTEGILSLSIHWNGQKNEIVKIQMAHMSIIIIN